MNEFKVNDYITLKLEYGKTYIYVKGEEFMICKYLLFNISDENREKYDKIKSIDEAADLLDKSMEDLNAPFSEEDALTEYGIPPETEFWAHSSNLQVWAESGYDMRLLHSNLAFPLLKELTEAGDPLANRIFKEEVVERFLKGPKKIREFLSINRGYIDSLTKEERRVLFKSYIEVIEELEEIMLKNFKHHRSRQIRIRTSYPKSINTIMWKEGKISGLNFDCSGLNMIPNSIQNLKDLEILILYAAPNEELPRWLSELKSLRHLELQSGKLKKISEWIEELKYLEHLDVHHNEIDYIPDSLGDLNRLKYLNLSDNNLEGIIPESIGSLSSLEHLELSNNKLKLIPESIGDIASLKKISIWNNKLDSLPESIGNLESLEELKLVGNNLTSIPNSIYKLKSLKELSLSHNPIESISEEVINLPSLRRLSLFNTRIDKGWHLKHPLEEKGVKLHFG